MITYSSFDIALYAGAEGSIPSSWTANSLMEKYRNQMLSVKKLFYFTHKIFFSILILIAT